MNLFGLLQFALSGAFMPVIYTIGVYSNGVWTADSWQPMQCRSPQVFSEDWVSLLYQLPVPALPTSPARMRLQALAAGIPMAEFLWGFWLWLCLLVPLSRYRQRSTCIYPAPRWYTMVARLTAAIVLTATVWYGFVVQVGPCSCLLLSALVCLCLMTLARSKTKPIGLKV